MYAEGSAFAPFFSKPFKFTKLKGFEKKPYDWRVPIEKYIFNFGNYYVIFVYFLQKNR